MKNLKNKIQVNIISLHVIHIFVILIKILVTIKKNITYFLVMNMTGFLRKS